MKKQEFQDGSIINIKLASHTVPILEEVRSNEYDYVLFSVDSTGKDRFTWRNRYPQYLIWLLNRSTDHNAIIGGKVKYICGKGFGINPEFESSKAGVVAQLKKINKAESADKVLNKIAFDLEVFNGFALQIIGTLDGKAWAEIYHIDFSKLRTNKDCSTFYYTSDWSKQKPENNPDWEIIPAYDPNKPQKKSILYYKGYRPNLEVYPFPAYIGALSYIECDYEIGNYHLNNLKNGFVGGTVISLNNGVPKIENQEVTERKMKQKFTGSDNAGNLIIMFSEPGKEPTVLNLKPSDMDKQFDFLGKTVQQKIFTGHEVTNPMLFGIMIPGLLGGRKELQEAFELFQNNYISYKQQIIEEIFNDLFEAKGLDPALQIIRTEPIGIGLDDATIAEVMTQDEKRDRAGLSPIENDGEGVTLDIISTLGQRTQPTVLQVMTVNELRKAVQLKPVPNGDELISTIATNGAGEQTPPDAAKQKAFKAQNDKKVIEAFKKYGKSKTDFNCLIKRPMKFASDSLDHEFAAALTGTLSTIEKKVLQLIKSDAKITPEDLAKSCKTTVDKITDTLSNLTTAGYIDDAGITKSGGNVLNDNPTTTSISAMYSYEQRPGVDGPVLLPTSRELCIELINADKYYSRSDINAISGELGYDVFSYEGGWWNHGDGTTTPYCRHIWQMNLVKKITQ